MTKIRFVRLNIACAFVCMHIHSFNVNANCLSLFRSFVLFSFGSGSSSFTFDFRSMIFQSIGVCVFFFRCLHLLPMVQVFGKKYAFQCILIRIYLCMDVPICVYYACASVVILCHCYRFTLSLCHRFTWTWVLVTRLSKPWIGFGFSIWLFVMR